MATHDDIKKTLETLGIPVFYGVCTDASKKDYIVFFEKAMYKSDLQPEIKGLGSNTATQIIDVTHITSQSTPLAEKEIINTLKDIGLTFREASYNVSSFLTIDEKKQSITTVTLSVILSFGMTYEL